MPEHDEAVREFLIESHDGLDLLDREFIALESQPESRERIAVIFRTIHTVKGTSGFLGYTKLESLTHAGESLLARLRDGSLSVTPPMIAALLALIDRVRTILRSIEASGAEGSTTVDDLKQTLLSLATESPTARTEAAPSTVSAPAVAAAPPSTPAPAAPAPVAPAVPVATVAPAAAAAPAPPAPAVSPSVAAPAATATPVARPSAPASAPAATTEGTSQVAESNVRVDVALLDKLMNLVGELVLARNQIIQHSSHIEDLGLSAATQRLNLITTELQEHVMKTRMQPIGNVWAKLPRVVRDLATTCGKQVRVEMHGKDTELDRTILEAIKDPLTHIVRNAVDHGLEAPQVRAARGKPKTGALTLRAFHEGGQVNIEISDDGGGLNLEAITRRAIERGLVTAERAARLSAHELMQFIFLPGFSTAEKVTNVSGRGVGMDVVKTNIEKIGGTVDLRSEFGVGTTLQIRIPLTLAIVPALIVVSAGQRFAIPQTNLLELVRLEGQALENIERLHGTRVYRLRGQLLPLVDLAEVLGLRTSQRDTDTAVNVIVLQSDDRQFGLIVDEVRDTEEIVVKPLGKEIKGITVFAGATIMGDGRVALILDVIGLAQQAHAAPKRREGTRADSTKRGARSIKSRAGEERRTLLLFSLAQGQTLALPLNSVARLEEFPRARIERAGGRAMVQYRGGILPLVDLSNADDNATAGSKLQVVVHSRGDRSVGFVVGNIVDIVEEAVLVEQCTDRTGVSGAGVVQGKVTEFLDVDSVARTHAPWLFEGAVS